MKPQYDFQHKEGLLYLSDIADATVDLILTDPPYLTSRESGMDKWVAHVAKHDSAGTNAKTEEQWGEFQSGRVWQLISLLEVHWETFNSKKDWEPTLKENNIDPEDAQAVERLRQNFKIRHVEKTFEKMKKEYIKYGSIYGAKYAVKTDYGEWDSDFTLETLEQFVKEFYRVLRPGGTAIIFFDLWKITPLADMMKTSRFKQLRMIEWIKTNPQPLNSSRNYLTNCREIALVGVKKSKPTFNSKYDNGVYRHPIATKDRFHPTQKSLPLFEELIKKHSNEGDLVVDPFAGSATTGVAALVNGRQFKGCELDEDFFKKANKRLYKTLKL